MLLFMMAKACQEWGNRGKGTSRYSTVQEDHSPGRGRVTLSSVHSGRPKTMNDIGGPQTDERNAANDRDNHVSNV